MPLDSQFNLSLELTKLVPLNLLGSVTANSIVALARRLRNSGSDIIVEQDLAQIFGRARITQQMDSTFRTVLSQQRDTSLTNNLRLHVGPGPTVARALKERAYFSTIVQLSLLTWGHARESLAQALTDFLESKCQALPQEYLSPPDPNGIAETLTAVEEQTSLFSWHYMLQAINASLEFPEGIGFGGGMPSVVLCGLLDMLPLVQTLPLDRMIHIQCNSGVGVIVAWAHHLLGLTVKVNTYRGKQVTFGNGLEQVFVEHSDTTSISLYDSSGDTNEILFVVNHGLAALKPISSTFRRPLRGYGKAVLLMQCSLFACTPSVLEDMMVITVAICRLIHGVLESENGRFSASNNHRIAEKTILETACLFFDVEISEAAVVSYANSYRSRALDDRLEPPASVCFIPRAAAETLQEVWLNFLDPSLELAVILLCLSFVDCISKCEDMLLAGSKSIRSHAFAREVIGWNGKSPIRINENTIFEVVLLTILGKSPKEESGLKGVSLLSNYGWTVYLPSFSEDDPAMVEVEKIKVVRGVPYRNDVRVRCIKDGPTESGDQHAVKIAGTGDVLESLSPNGRVHITRGKTMFSRDADSYATTTIIPFMMKFAGMEEHQITVRRTSYYHLHRSLWHTRLTNDCLHRENQPFELPLDCEAFIGFPQVTSDGRGSRIAICLTEDDAEARWCTLLGKWYNWHKLNKKAIGSVSDTEQPGRFPGLMLRTNDCCLGCAVGQAANTTGKWIIIL